MDIRVFGICGKSGAGKTTLIKKLIKALKEKGLKVATIKEAGPKFDPDLKGSDSYEHRKAGARGVALYNGSYFQIVEERKVELEEILNYFSDYDIILVEGFKASNIDKAEIIRKGHNENPSLEGASVKAYLTDIEGFESDKKVLDLNNIQEIVKLIVEWWLIL